MPTLEVFLTDGRSEVFQTQNDDESYGSELNDDGSLSVYLTIDSSEGDFTEEEVARYRSDEWIETEESSI
jgi:hypothetical protein